MVRLCGLWCSQPGAFPLQAWGWGGIVEKVKKVRTGVFVGLPLPPWGSLTVPEVYGEVPLLVDCKQKEIKLFGHVQMVLA